jgi:hypothetical protein
MNDSNTNLKRFSRDDRLVILAQTCVDNDISPLKGNFAGLIRKVCLSHLKIGEAATKELTRTLTVMYRTDQWISLLNPVFDEVPGESGLTPNRIALEMPQTTTVMDAPPSITQATHHTQERESIHTEMLKLASNTHPKPIKTVEAKQTIQTDHLTEQQIARVLYGVAQRDTFDGVGRIILSDARTITDDKHLQIDDLLTLWRKYYPIIDIDSKSNVALIYWEGKDTMRDQRDIKKFVQPTAPVYTAKTNPDGDISEDEEVEVVKDGEES